MICDDLRTGWEVAHPVHVISWALLDHVIASQRNKELLFQELTCPAWHPDTDETQYSTVQRSNRKTYSVCICECVSSYSKCLHKCWFCFSKMFSSAFFFFEFPLTAPAPFTLFTATHRLAPQPLALSVPFLSCQIKEWICATHPGFAREVCREVRREAEKCAQFNVSGSDFNDSTMILTEQKDYSNEREQSLLRAI